MTLTVNNQDAIIVKVFFLQDIYEKHW